MSGPQFEKPETPGNKISQWLKDNKTKTTVLILALVVLVGGLYLFSNKQSKQSTSVLGGISQNGQEAGSQTGQKPETLAQTQSQSKETPKIEETTDKEIKERAQKGQGITHLARRAAKTYLEQNPDLKDKISKEQKIYIEDYLKDKIKEGLGKKGLKTGDEISFDKDLIKKAIEASQKLTAEQLKNLSGYTKLVPSL